jgi:hypothetical protein
LRGSLNNAADSAGALMTVAASDHEARRTRFLEYLKLGGSFIVGVGTLLTVLAGLHEYSNQRQQNELTDLFTFVANIDHGNAATSFRNDLQALILQLYQAPYSGSVDVDLAQNSMKVNKFIRDTLLKTNFFKFKGVLSFIDTMHVYARTGACPWKFFAPAFRNDANMILYYFGPVLYDKEFTAQQGISPVNLENFSTGKLTDAQRNPINLTPACQF